VKKQKDCRENWANQMILAQAAEQNTTKAKLWKGLKQTNRMELSHIKESQASTW